MALLAVRDLELHYGTPRGAVRAVDAVTFEVGGAGETVGIIGETGSGKSSLVMALTRILPRNVDRYRGEVILEGAELMGLSSEEFRRDIRWKKISVVFQGAMNGFNPVIRVGEQVAERLRVERHSRSREIRSAVEALLGEVGLSADTYSRFPHELSGGMKQRAAIAMALVLRPPLVILDEPTSALDVSVQAQIMNMLKRLKWDHGISMLFVTHDIALASDLSDFIVVMYAGQVRECGPADGVLVRPQDPYTQELLASIPLLHADTLPRFVTGSAPDPVEPVAGCRFYPRCSRAFEPCSRVSPPLFELGGGHRARCWLLDAERSWQN